MHQAVGKRFDHQSASAGTGRKNMPCLRNLIGRFAQLRIIQIGRIPLQLFENPLRIVPDTHLVSLFSAKDRMLSFSAFAACAG